VYSQLKNNSDDEIKRLLKSFPILARQWSSISSFKDNILQKVGTALTVSQPDAAVTEALASMMLLSDTSCSQACSAFLEARSRAIVALLEVASDSGDGGGGDDGGGGGGGGGGASKQICQAVSLLVETIRQLYALFHIDPIATKTEQSGALYTYLRDVTAGSQRSGGVGSGGSREGEGASNAGGEVGGAPAAFVPTLPEGSALPIGTVALHTLASTWLDSISELAAAAGVRTLRSVETVGALAQCRDAVWTLLQQQNHAIGKLLPEALVGIVDETQELALDRLCGFVVGDAPQGGALALLAVGFLFCTGATLLKLHPSCPRCLQFACSPERLLCLPPAACLPCCGANTFLAVFVEGLY
jgi:hypothetical protein